MKSINKQKRKIIGRIYFCKYVQASKCIKYGSPKTPQEIQSIYSLIIKGYIKGELTGKLQVFGNLSVILTKKGLIEKYKQLN